MKYAAAMLVNEGPRILVFRRYDAEGLSFPCGKIDPGETPEEAAIREVKEETGYDVRIIKNVEPFVGYDIKGHSLVYTFRGEIIGGTLIENAPCEGVPLWASASQIAYGPYWHYNQRALRHFGIQIPLTGKFHSHLTIETKSVAEADRAAELVRGKITVINLARDTRDQTDCMITHHYVTGIHGIEDEHDIIALLESRADQLKRSGVTVLRAKLEHEPLDKDSNRRDLTESLSRIYTEIHIKCIVSDSYLPHLISCASAEGWHPSRNPYAKQGEGMVVQFVNRRFYGTTTLPIIDAAVDTIVSRIINLCTIEEIKYESAVYDSNEEHDRWWMKSEKS